MFDTQSEKRFKDVISFFSGEEPPAEVQELADLTPPIVDPIIEIA